MLSRLREHLGMAGVIVAIVALVAALGGGAIAATGGSGDGAEATASAKGKQGPRGPKGPKGAKGATGPAGPQGPAGPVGPAGAAGAKGADGAPGAAGAKGATGPTGAAGSAGTAGATGSTGATGATGFSGFTETLPAGKTETGAWSAGPLPGGPEAVEFVAISFPIPLASAAGNANVKVVPPSGPVPTGCTGGTAAAPKADPGFLCVYTGFSSDPEAGLGPVTYKPSMAPDQGRATTGALLTYGSETGAEGAFGWGTYAVTAP